jgi:hypothetical protein
MLKINNSFVLSPTIRLGSIYLSHCLGNRTTLLFILCFTSVLSPTKNKARKQQTSTNKKKKKKKRKEKIIAPLIIGVNQNYKSLHI